MLSQPINRSFSYSITCEKILELTWTVTATGRWPHSKGVHFLHPHFHIAEFCQGGSGWAGHMGALLPHPSLLTAAARPWTPSLASTPACSVPQLGQWTTGEWVQALTPYSHPGPWCIATQPGSRNGRGLVSLFSHSPKLGCGKPWG